MKTTLLLRAVNNMLKEYSSSIIFCPEILFLAENLGQPLIYPNPPPPRPRFEYYCRHLSFLEGGGGLVVLTPSPNLKPPLQGEGVVGGAPAFENRL